ncbi:MAG TPA: class I adenylate-forming enzyme family protein [Candidatus Acidoferrum sp.]|nr:class I adenylate-forming enzyme family protein [Candidatus Acidoferrum sp.]
MLYDRWREIAREFSSELALRDLPSGREWTFSQLAAAADAQTPWVQEVIVFPQGNTPEFVFALLRAWRDRSVVCPIEPGQTAPEFLPPPARVAHLKITSATSGAPKLVAMTAEQLAADAENIVGTMGLKREWPSLAFISLAHSYGFSNLITPLLLHGIPLILGGTPLPEIVRRAVACSGNVTLAAVPTLWRVWHEAGVISADIRLAISAGAPLPLALEQEVFARHALKIHNFYGASECGGIAYDSGMAPRVDTSCVGESMRNVYLEINGDGCLEVRGGNVAEMYWPDSDPVLAPGIYRTSDLAEIRDGQVFLRGRAGDVINVAARKIAPESIERLLATHPDVRDCLVFGVPDRDGQRGDVIVACVVARNGTNVESLRQFLLARSDAWQVPREFWFIDSLEVNQRGKLSRAEWRKKFLQAKSA